MNAREARKRRGGTTLLERTKADPVRATSIDRLVAAASIEQLVQALMDREHVTAAELARRINVKPPQVSRDLRGGLSKATIGRLSMIAEALGYDFVPAFIPRTDNENRSEVLKKWHEFAALCNVEIFIKESGASVEDTNASPHEELVH